jgi:hypothetical protein
LATTTAEFFTYAICVGNAGESASWRESSLICGIFSNLAPQLNLSHNDLFRVSALIRERYLIFRPIFEKDPTSMVLNYLERHDQLSGTAGASRYRELVLRMANMLASAGGKRSEAKLSCVAKIEKAL